MSAPRPEEFTEELRKVLARAADLVKKRGGVHVEPTHLLLALLAEPWTAATRVLSALGVDTAQVQAALEAGMPRKRAAAAQPIVGPAMDQVLRVAVSEARRYGEGFVGTEHVLVGLLAVRDGMACAVLEEAGARLEVARTYARTHRILATDLGSARRAAAEPAGAASAERDWRVGVGYDVHEVLPGGTLILGGVQIPGEIGLRGHSDADVLCHAIMDALLGASALGDIGCLFPDSDPSYAGISSITLLEDVVERLAGEGWRPHNVDAVVVAQRPKVAPHVPRMRQILAAAMGLDPARVGVKGTTTEGLGFEGDGLGIGAHAVAIVVAA